MWVIIEVSHLIFPVAIIALMGESIGGSGMEPPRSAHMPKLGAVSLLLQASIS
jgi:hypothetical protein